MAGQFAVNPQTGEVAQLVGNAWQPVPKQNIATNPNTGAAAVYNGQSWEELPTPSTGSNLHDFFNSTATGIGKGVGALISAPESILRLSRSGAQDSAAAQNNPDTPDATKNAISAVNTLMTGAPTLPAIAPTTPIEKILPTPEGMDKLFFDKSRPGAFPYYVPSTPAGRIYQSGVSGAAGGAIGGPVAAALGALSGAAGSGAKEAGLPTWAQAGISIAAPLLAGQIPKIGSSLTAMASGDTQMFARNLILNALAKDGVSAPQALTKYNAWQMAGSKPETLMDLGGDATQRLARVIYTMGGAPANDARTLLQNRTGSMGDRVAGDLEQKLGTSGSAYTAKDQLDAQRDAVAAPLYDKARAANPAMNSPEIQAVLKTDDGAAALAQSQKWMRNEGLPIGDEKGGWSLKQLDYVKRALDDIRSGALRGGQNNAARITGDLTHRLLNEVDAMDTSGTYAQARAAFAGPTQTKAAMDAGYDAFKEAPEVVGKQFGAVQPQNRAYFKLGMVQAVKDKIMAATDSANVALKIFGNPAMRNRIAAVFDTPQEFDAWQQGIMREINMGKSGNFVLSGSQTTNKAADVFGASAPKGPTLGGTIFDTIATGGNKWPAIKYGLSKLALRAQGLSASRAKSAIPLLLNTDPAANTSTLNQMLEQAMMKQRIGNITQLLKRGAPAGIAGGLLNGP